MNDLILSDIAKEAWISFLANKSNLGHAYRRLNGGDIDSHVNDGMKSARATIARLKNDLGKLAPKVILEIGCSAGLNCLAMAEAFPCAEVIGLEPEQEALYVAESTCGGRGARQPRFVRGVGESIPLPDHSVDLIICHTVIEHVQDVSQTISEIARVLSPIGVAHLEAPNYIWPFEPHLEIWTIPILGKTFVKLCAHLQGKGSMTPFLEHLKFVTPFQLEKIFIKNKLSWHNRTGDKIRNVMKGDGDVKQYKRISRLLALPGRAGLAEPFVLSIIKSGMYPSVLYTLRHDSCV